MTTWTADELNKIGKAEELDIMSRRADGTLRSPVTIWVVPVGDDLFVRAVKGRTGPWFRGTQERHEGRIQAGGVEREVAFVQVMDPELNRQIDAAYRTKYRRYAANIVGSVQTPESSEATLKLVPRKTGA
jgi:hypothetical protein